jgi:DNA-binding LacI/PurR family transcriptional regulator
MPKRPTSADVAAVAGVSRTTVSFVLNGRADVKIPDETRQRVVDAAARLGYQPNASARQLAGGRSHIIALVLHQSPEQVASDAVLAETLRGLSAAARAGGFRVMVELLEPDGPDSSYSSLLRAQHADGLIVSGPRSDDPSLLEMVRDGFPIVLQGSLPDVAVMSVDVDNVAGARGAVEHLLALGHRRIACITNAPLVYTAAQERLTGYT